MFLRFSALYQEGIPIVYPNFLKENKKNMFFFTYR